MDIVPYSHHTILIITCSLHFSLTLIPNFVIVILMEVLFWIVLLFVSFLVTAIVFNYVFINIHIFESFTKICFCSIIPVHQGNLRWRESSSLYHTCSFAYNKTCFCYKQKNKFYYVSYTVYTNLIKTMSQSYSCYLHV